MRQLAAEIVEMKRLINKLEGEENDKIIDESRTKTIPGFVLLNEDWQFV